ncbi:hypothetical protein ISN44_As06g035780 [Arabidopsis suecica]|uniref:DUF4283 domain-containing protein n=1 Tax=Arabidopsis suecica TaxID=45249 RepID=A0A8T2CIV2_ARASU|nr:hypothetical protein ISN44_As06g035780 [Arabidopsis suecica]
MVKEIISISDEIHCNNRSDVMAITPAERKLRIWLFQGKERIRRANGKDRGIRFWGIRWNLRLCKFADWDSILNEEGFVVISWIVIFLVSAKGKFVGENHRKVTVFFLSFIKTGFRKSKVLIFKEGFMICSLWCQCLRGFLIDSLGCIYIKKTRFNLLIIAFLKSSKRGCSQQAFNFLSFSFHWVLLFGLLLVNMAQLAMNKGKAAMVRTETVKISGSLLSQRIQQFSLTLIGRLINHSIQRMDSLVANMPKIWKMEDKVIGADLGKDIFQFNFHSEEDLQGVFLNAPYHFDGWMVALVRYEPIISSTYPSAINFWVKVYGLPMHLSEEVTLTAVGKKVGLIREIDVDSGSILITVNE